MGLTGSQTRSSGKCIVKCAFCGVEFRRKPSELKSLTPCCSHDCSMRLRNGWTATTCGKGHDISNPKNLRLRQREGKIVSRECKICMLETNRNRKQSIEQKEKIRLENRNRVYRKYGMTKDQWEALLAAQNNCCALCGKPFEVTAGLRAHTDHDHKTGKVRGLLHGKCNTAIGLLDDDSERCKLAALYLERNGL